MAILVPGVKESVNQGECQLGIRTVAHGVWGKGFGIDLVSAGVLYTFLGTMGKWAGKTGVEHCWIVMEIPNHPNDPNVPEGEQAPAAPDGFAPQWIGEHDPNNNNGWIEWDVPLRGEMNEPMIDP
nr:hypothetical protein [Tanacetum cinerariifolium]